MPGTDRVVFAVYDASTYGLDLYTVPSGGGTPERLVASSPPALRITDFRYEAAANGLLVFARDAAAGNVDVFWQPL